MTFLSSILLGNGVYSSNQIFAQQENEAEIEVDIEQENKCKKDSECENENEINNSLNIVGNGTQSQQSPPVTPTCETCFTDNLTPEQITAFELAMTDGTNGDLTSIEEFCIFAEQNVNNPEFIAGILAKAGFGAVNFGAEISVDELNNIADCLEELYGIIIPPFTT